MRQIEILTYQNELGESITFAHNAVFVPQEIMGLTDVRNTIFSIGSMGQDGDTFIGNKIEARDIDIAGLIRERDAVKMREQRRLLARVLNPQLAATLTYQFGEFVRVTDCRSINAPSITRPVQSVYTAFSVQLTCLNPFWRDRAESRDDIAAWVGSFEFPLEIPEGGMEFGYRQPSLIVNVYNAGDVKAGIRAVFRALGEVVNPMIVNVNTQDTLRINMRMVDGDELTISTGYGEKWASLNNEGEISDALYYVDVDSVFLQLQPGDNLIRYSAESGLENLDVSIYHNNLYLGV